MIRDFFVLFDEQITSAVAYTGDAFSTRLAMYDQAALQLIVDTTTLGAAGTLTVTVQESARGASMVTSGTEKEWVDVYTPLSAKVVPADTTIGFYANLGPIPLLSFVRLKLALGGAITSAHVRIYATLRDASG